MKMNKHYNELKASYLFVDIAHKVAAYQEAHPEKEIIRLGIEIGRASCRERV